MAMTDEQIRMLWREAGDHNDYDMAAYCEKALNGDGEARAICGRIVADVEAEAEHQTRD